MHVKIYEWKVLRRLPGLWVFSWIDIPDVVAAGVIGGTHTAEVSSLLYDLLLNIITLNTPHIAARERKGCSH